MNRPKNREKGIALVLVLLLIVVVFGSAAVFFSRSVNEVQNQRDRTAGVQAVWNANALIEQAKLPIETSSYSAQGNDWLVASASPTPVIQNARGSLTVTALTIPWYELTATSTVGGVSKTVRVRVRDRDLFSKYLFFTHADDINIGTTSVKGEVHTNQSLNFYYGGAELFGQASAVTGVNFYIGATPGTTTFHQGYNPSAEPIAWPSMSALSSLGAVATGVYQVTPTSPGYSGAGSFDTEIEFLGDQVRILTRNGSGVLTDNTYPLPANQLIYVEGDVTSLKGDLNGRVSLATLGKVDLTGSVKYVDAEGDAKFYNSEGGWTVEEYTQNPAYNGTSVLGVMAQDDITITSQAPFNMEMMGAYMSVNGNWHADLSQVKGHLRYSGSMIIKNRGWRYSGYTGKGWSASGLYTYDEDMRNDPPPHFLQVEATGYRAWEIDS